MAARNYVPAEATKTGEAAGMEVLFYEVALADKQNEKISLPCFGTVKYVRNGHSICMASLITY